MLEAQPVVLDCTFRDGGYYNNWDFDPNTVKRYLAVMEDANVDIVEIGFRMPPQLTFLGPFAYSTDAYLRTLPIPEGMTVAVMVNADDLICSEISAAVDALFVPALTSVVSVVRIAAHLKHVSPCREIADRLSTLGYRVILNVMQAGSYASVELTKVAAEVDGWGSVEALYFADSLGNMDVSSVRETTAAFAAGWRKPIGFHGHNNRGLGVVNTLAALDAGVTYVDSTILGMGRGAGNAQTEALLVELARRGATKYTPEAVFPLVLSEFAELQRQCGWGQNLYYYLAAEYGIHPTYIQELLSESRYGPEDILSAINFLRQTGAKSYNADTLTQAMLGDEPDTDGTWRATGWAIGKTVLIIGPGEQGERHLAAVADFVRQRDPLVLCLNINKSFPAELVSAYVVCHESRLMIEAHQFKRLQKPLFLPMARVPQDVKASLGSVEVRDYGLKIVRNTVEIRPTGCSLPQSLAAAYAIALAFEGGAAKIVLVGFDGYATGDRRQEEMIEIFERFHAMESVPPIVAITPTTYPVTQRSVYEPGL
jgi:4-hydroxy 2-oxovalerate aldolase